jgi:hypothetical protein
VKLDGQQQRGPHRANGIVGRQEQEPVQRQQQDGGAFAGADVGGQAEETIER